MIRVESFNDHPNRRIRHDEIRKTARAVFRGEGAADVTLRVIFTGDAAMKRLHRVWLGKPTTTDVLTFPLESGRGKPLDAEIYVNLDQCRRQARDVGVSDRHEIARLVVHGSLHLVGFRDSTPALRRTMSAREDLYLRRLDVR